MSDRQQNPGRPKLTAPQMRMLRGIANGRKVYRIRWSGNEGRTLRVLERVHVIRRGPESQHRYGPLTKRGREVIASADDS